MQRVVSRHFPILNFGQLSLNSVPCLLVFPNCHLSSLLVSARVLDDFRGISCFVMFYVTRAVLETLPNHAQLVACFSQRAAVKSRHTQQRFVLWLRRLHELANPWKRLKSLVMF